MNKLILAVSVSAILLAAAVSLGRDPSWGGLAAVAVSPDGKTLVTGGQNRVIYVLDASTLEVRKRIWASARVGQLAFNRDGTRLVLEDDDENLTFYDTATYEALKTVSRASDMNCAPAADLLAMHREVRDQAIHFLSMTDGNEKGSIPFSERIAAFGLDSSGSRLVVLTEAVKNEEEPRVPVADTPKDLKGVEKKIYEQKHDARTSSMLVYEVPSGKLVSRHELWYSTSSGRVDVVVTEKFAAVLNYGNENARIYFDGKIEFFQCDNSFNYGRGYSQDRKWAMTGGLRRGTLTNLENLEATGFEVDKVPGWPEYFEGFTFGPDGTGFGVTSACRLVVLSRKGEVQKAVPVY